MLIVCIKKETFRIILRNIQNKIIKNYQKIKFEKKKSKLKILLKKL